MGGSGPIGLPTAAVLKGMGVTTIISELSQARKEKATSSGVADHVLDPSKEDVPSRVAELTDGTGVGVAFECAGVNVVLDTMLDAVRPGAVVVNVSIWGAAATVDMQKLVLKEIDLRGTVAYVRDHPAVIRMVQEGKMDLNPFITGRIALEDLVEQGFDTLINRKDTAVKVLVHSRGWAGGRPAAKGGRRLDAHAVVVPPTLPADHCPGSRKHTKGFFPLSSRGLVCGRLPP